MALLSLFINCGGEQLYGLNGNGAGLDLYVKELCTYYRTRGEETVGEPRLSLEPPGKLWVSFGSTDVGGSVKKQEGAEKL